MANRLANESSPYLLQHQNNPVDWQPWDQRALKQAQTEDKPIFLSIGYSACHWCHVMEHESFENDEIAAFLNENFVSIKVDREERPDLDHIYMQAVMALSGHGGWPLSAFLTPEQNFFFGGTYWPPVPSRGMPGFLQVLHSVGEAFRSKRDSLEQQAIQITELLKKNSAALHTPQSVIQHSTVHRAIDSLSRSFDSTHGGFGSAPKFPHPIDLELLLRVLSDGDDDSDVSPSRIQEMIVTTLNKMAYGGIYDHLGGGFARYSVDERWLVPHFEKMLYDNAQLASVYTMAHRVTGNPLFQRTAVMTLEYVMSDLLDEAGGIHSTEDADSEGVEGKFYVWSKAEILEQLGAEIGQRFCELHGVTDAGNFEGSNILHVVESYGDFADRHGMEKSALREEMRTARATLLQARNLRIRPGKDDKVLVSWNALAIDAFAKAAVQFDKPDFLDVARQCTRFLLSELKSEGRLLHTWRQGVAKLDAYLDDYAYLINALITLYEADFDPHWIDEAVDLLDILVEHFSDAAGGFFFTADDHETLIVRTKDLQDSSVPSGNAMAATALLRLGRLCGNDQWIQLAEQTMETASGLIERAPAAAGQMLIAIDLALQPNRQLVLVVPSAEAAFSELIHLLQTTKGIADSLVVHVETENNQSRHLAKVLAGKHSLDGQPALFVCENYVCDQPVVGADNIQQFAVNFNKTVTSGN